MRAGGNGQACSGTDSKVPQKGASKIQVVLTGKIENKQQVLVPRGSCQIEFIGPTPEAMEKLGDKNTARDMARAAKVPIVPGSDGLLETEEEAAAAEAEKKRKEKAKAAAAAGEAATAKPRKKKEDRK